MLKEEKNLNQSEITTDDDFKKISEEFEKEKEAEYEKKKGKIYYGDKNNFVNQYAFVATALRLLREDYLNGNLSDKEINQVEQLRDWGWQNTASWLLHILPLSLLHILPWHGQLDNFFQFQSALHKDIIRYIPFLWCLKNTVLTFCILLSIYLQYVFIIA